MKSVESEILERIKYFRQELHNHPEASEEEIQTRASIKRYLEKYTDAKIVDKGRWLYAIKDEGAKETIAFLADHDAIVSEDGNAFHGCGHDGHTAILVGLAEVLDRQELSKNIVYIFQHAEENGVGAKEAVEILDEIKIDRIYALHNLPGLPQGEIATRKGTMFCASKGMSIKFTGVQSHASEPEHGVNPVYSIGELTEFLKPLSEFKGFRETKFADDVYSSMILTTIISIRVGESGAYGVSPSQGEIQLTLRAEKLKDLDKLTKKIQEKAEKLATNDGLKLEINFSDEFPDTSNNSGEVDRIVKIFKRNDIKVHINEEPIRGSEDFGWFLNEIPGAYFQIGSGLNQPELHSVEFNFPDEILVFGIQCMEAIAKE